MRGTRRLLLLIALWAGIGAVVALPAHAEQVQQCRSVSGRFVLSPGLTDIRTDQTITAHGRLTGCSSGGGSAAFAATINAAQVTCASLASGLLPAEVAFGWSDGQSTIASLRFSSPPGSPNKVLVTGTAVSGAALGSRIEGGLRLSVQYPPAATKPHARTPHARQELVPLVSRANACSPKSPLTTINVTNFEGFAMGTPKLRPVTRPAARPTLPRSARPATSTPTAATATTTTIVKATTTTRPPVTVPRHVKPRRRRAPVKTKSVAIGALGSPGPGPGSSSSLSNPESLLAVGMAVGSVCLLGLLFYRRSRLMRGREASRRVIG